MYVIKYKLRIYTQLTILFDNLILPKNKKFNCILLQDAILYLKSVSLKQYKAFRHLRTTKFVVIINQV